MNNLIVTLALLTSFFFSYHKHNEKISCKFSVLHNCSEYIVNEIDNAKESIEFCIYIFTDKNISNALIKACERGVKVRGVIEKKNSNKLAEKLKNKKMVKLKGSEGLMHHKFLIIDRRKLLTGSYNYTYSADNRNDENFLIIKDKSIVSKYYQEFLRLWDK